MSSVWELIIKIFKGGPDNADVAKERLKLVVKQDRVKITPQAKEEIRSDILKLISQYVEIDEASLQIDIQQDNQTTALVASMPVKGGRAEITGKKKIAAKPRKAKSTQTPKKTSKKTAKKTTAKKSKSSTKTAKSARTQKTTAKKKTVKRTATKAKSSKKSKKQ